MNIFQRKNSKRVKDTDGSQKKDGSNRGKTDLLDRARGGLGDLAGGLRSAKNDAGAATEKLQGDVKSGIETILSTGIGILEKAEAELGSHSEATSSKELERGSEEQGAKNMEAFSAVLDEVKSNPEVAVEKVKEVMNRAEAFHLTKHESKEQEADDKANDGEAAGNVDDESTFAGKTEGLGAVEHVVEEIKAAVAAVQQQQTVGEETETGTEAEASPEVPAAKASAEGEKTEVITREVEKDDPTKRIDFLGFFTMLFERFCSRANKND